MSQVFVTGLGAVSPAGWGVTALRDALHSGNALPVRQLACPGRDRPLSTRGVPTPASRLGFAAHPRMRRSSPIGQFAVAAALEALGDKSLTNAMGTDRLGIVYCSMSGCVNFSRRFYDETLKDPSTASPLIFPETVFNAPASHLGALLGSSSVNYTLVGDAGTFLQGVALGAEWLVMGKVDGCLVVGAEELDWLVAQALDLFDPKATLSEGAGALYLQTHAQANGAVELKAVSGSHPFSTRLARFESACRARAEIENGCSNALLCDGFQGVERLDRDEVAAWSDWKGPRCSPKLVLGEAFAAAAAWQCAAAIDALARGAYDNATVSVVGCNQQSIAARFGKP